ncbi:hypothetical protein [Terrabacter sp. Root181]|uniref:hypothetical protein n=1 Tax=Terrabacter sp. Root181 TaxID=1736484 RepID=UPI0006F32C07|nr:hypothetical protein [Terrabacter sp. Root181]KRB44272.1 hypothetical protein ASD90_17930 [Terrabacter sp. Root181]
MSTDRVADIVAKVLRETAPTSKNLADLAEWEREALTVTAARESITPEAALAGQWAELDALDSKESASEIAAWVRTR